MRKSKCIFESWCSSFKKKMRERTLKRKFVLNVQKLKTQKAVLILVYCKMISFKNHIHIAFVVESNLWVMSHKRK